MSAAKTAQMCHDQQRYSPGSVDVYIASIWGNVLEIRNLSGIVAAVLEMPCNEVTSPPESIGVL